MPPYLVWRTVGRLSEVDRQAIIDWLAVRSDVADTRVWPIITFD